MRNYSCWRLGPSLRRRSRSRSRRRRCCWSTSIAGASGSTASRPLGTKERWKDAAPIYVTFAVARMLAVNGATFDRLVQSGLSPGQVDDGLARLGKRVHRTDIGWEVTAGGRPRRLHYRLLPRAGRRSDPVDVRAAAHRAGGPAHRSGLPHLRPCHLRQARLPRHQQKKMPYRVVAFTEQKVDMAALGFEPDTIGFAGTELIRPADPTIFLTAAAAGYTDRTDEIITANTLPAPTTATPTTRHHCKKYATGCSSSRTPVRPATQPAELTGKSHQTGVAPTCRRCFTELRPHPSRQLGLTSTCFHPNRVPGQAIRLRVTSTNQPIGQLEPRCTGNGSDSSRTSVPRAASSSENGWPGTPTIRTTTTHDRDSRSPHRRSHTGPSPRRHRTTHLRQVRSQRV